MEGRVFYYSFHNTTVSASASFCVLKKIMGYVVASVDPQRIDQLAAPHHLSSIGLPIAHGLKLRPSDGSLVLIAGFIFPKYQWFTSGDWQGSASLRTSCTYGLGLFTMYCSHAFIAELENSNWQIAASKTLRSYSLKRRRRLSHSLKQPSLIQLTNTVRDAHRFNSSTFKAGNTNPLKRRRGAKRHVTKTLALFEATIT